MKASRNRRSATRGSTVIEVLMAISVLAIGASGILALQKATTVANREAKSLETANEIARTWLERLRADGLKWNYSLPLDTMSDIDSDTVWLANNVRTPGTANALNWFRPTNATQQVYGVHDVFGKDDQSGNLNGPYCANLRLTWLRTSQGLIRAEVRVYWLRQGIQPGVLNLSQQPANPLCGNQSGNPAPSVTGANDVYHFVHAATAIAKNAAY